jgi:hexulose-6-phosphate isomerase
MFMRGVAAASLGVPLAANAASQPASAQSPAPGASRRTLRKAAMIGMVSEGDTIQEKFEILRECGFEGVELNSPSDLDADEVLKAMDKTGLKVHGLVDSVHWKWTLNSPEQEVREKAMDALETALLDGKKFGCVSVLLVPAVVNDKLPYDRAWELSQEATKRVLPVAEETGVKIAVENVWNNFLLSPMEARRYLEEINSPLVGWHFDIGNVINFGWPEQWVRILGKQILKLHIKDFSRRKRDEEGLWKGFNVELGDGDAGWPAVMKALDEVGYSTATPGNWATAEVRGGDSTRLKTISQQMDKLFAM